MHVIAGELYCIQVPGHQRDPEGGWRALNGSPTRRARVIGSEAVFRFARAFDFILGPQGRRGRKCRGLAVQRQRRGAGRPVNVQILSQ